eukprot:9716185-Alexandrium_andersonii.AAC.1
MRHSLRRSKLQLRLPRNGLNICPRSSRGVRSALFFRGRIDEVVRWARRMRLSGEFGGRSPLGKT